MSGARVDSESETKCQIVASRGVWVHYCAYMSRHLTLPYLAVVAIAEKHRVLGQSSNQP